MKPVRLTHHARARARERGASEEEVRQAVRQGVRAPARAGKWQARHRLPYGGLSPFDGVRYNEKTVEVVFAEEPDENVVVTVKVFYGSRED